MREEDSLSGEIGNFDGEGECGLRASPIVSEGREQSRDRTIGSDSGAGGPPRRRRILGKERRLDGVVLSVLCEGQQDQIRLSRDHEASARANGGFGIKHGR